MPKGQSPGPGRPKGALNKENKQLREMILEALDNKGGAAYLAEKAESHPQAFMSLLGRVLPTTLDGTIKHQGLASILASLGSGDD
jgi:hypothetical protein